MLDNSVKIFRLCRSERIERLCQIHNEGYGDLPATLLSSVRTMTTQMLEDIEDKLDIIDRYSP